MKSNVYLITALAGIFSPPPYIASLHPRPQPFKGNSRRRKFKGYQRNRRR